jgi:hypothetical protein
MEHPEPVGVLSIRTVGTRKETDRLMSLPVPSGPVLIAKGKCRGILVSVT